MITLCGKLLVSRKFAIRDEPNFRLRCPKKCQKTLVLPMKTTRLTTTSPAVSPSLSTVYTFETSPYVPAPRALEENTCARGAGIHGVFSVSHTTHTPRQHDNTTTTPHGDRHRERQRQREKTRRKRRERQENRREKREQRRFIFSAVVYGRSLLMECSVSKTRQRPIPLPAKQCQVRFIFHFFQRILAVQLFFF